MHLIIGQGNTPRRFHAELSVGVGVRCEGVGEGRLGHGRDDAVMALISDSVMGIKVSEIAGVLSQGFEILAHKAPKYAVDAASQHVGTYTNRHRLR